MHDRSLPHQCSSPHFLASQGTILPEGMNNFQAPCRKVFLLEETDAVEDLVLRFIHAAAMMNHRDRSGVNPKTVK
jgi:hypothetical protein